MMKMTTALRTLISENKIVVAPGVFDGLSALLAKRQGFSVLYASGGAIARSAGYPDIGLLTMTEVSSVIAHMVTVTNLPIIADADTGYGSALNVRRTVQIFERLGVAGIHLEDQTFPKRCGHLNDKSLISIDEMCHKLQTAIKSKIDPDFVIIARTDAIAVEGFDAAIQRAKAYLQAGADVIFIEAPESVEQIEKIAMEISQPKLINMFYSGKTPLVSTQKLQELGYNIIIIPSDLQRASIKAIQTTLKAIYKNGNSMEVSESLATFQEREEIIETEKYLQMD